jgi:hypothetical protein
MLRSSKAPGSLAARGIYWVHHYRHRVTHLCKVDGGLFPPCNTCGDAVRYELAVGRTTAPVIWDDADFAVAKAPRKSA